MESEWDNVNLLGENLTTIKKNMEALLTVCKEGDLNINVEHI
jgi:hypothetical protein